MLNSMMSLYRLNLACKEMIEEINKIREFVAELVAEQLKIIKSELEKELGFRIMKINVARYSLVGDVFIEILGCYKEMYKDERTAEEINKRLAEILEKRYKVPSDVTNSIIVVGSISRNSCPFREECEDVFCY